MTPTGRRWDWAGAWLPVFGVALLGVILGHGVTYLIAVPALTRASVLAATGHAYWPNAVSAGLLAGPAAMGGVAIRHFRSGLQGRNHQPVRYLPAAWRLGGLQLLVFTLIEVSERAAVGGSITSMFQDRIYPVGIVVQILVAVIGALMLVSLARASEALGASLHRRRPRPFASVIRSAYAYRPGPSPLCDACPPRGPPLLPGPGLTTRLTPTRPVGVGAPGCPL
jgi:hypothetical protein